MERDIIKSTNEKEYKKNKTNGAIRNAELVLDMKIN
jgi:hypothetical protein